MTGLLPKKIAIPQPLSCPESAAPPRSKTRQLFDVQGRGIIRLAHGNRAKVSVTNRNKPKAPGQTTVRMVACDASIPEPNI